MSVTAPPEKPVASSKPKATAFRVTDVTGRVQPTVEALETKKTFLEDNSQFPRKVMVG